jgi:hypothetical protein
VEVPQVLVVVELGQQLQIFLAVLLAALVEVALLAQLLVRL